MLTETRVVGFAGAAVMFLLAALHAYWAAGGRRGSAVAVPSMEGQAAFSPGPIATIAVAALLLAAALVLLGRMGSFGQSLPRWFFATGAWTIASVFAARVIGDFRWFGIFRRVNDTSFAWWDARLYIPLSAFLAIAAAMVAFNGPGY
jgi:hypothetical protein